MSKAIKLDVTGEDGSHHYTVSFYTEDQALAYITPKIKTHCFDQRAECPIPMDWARVHGLLYPTCHHGLSLQMCMDPVGEHHFGTADWERAQYGDW